MQVAVSHIPSEAGTHFAGQGKAPGAINIVGGLEEKLENLGLLHTKGPSGPSGIFEKSDAKDLIVWKPSPKTDGVRNLTETLKVMKAIWDYNTQDREQASRDRFHVFLGGNCSITPAIFSSFSHGRPDKKVGLLYMDGDADLTLPSQASVEGSSGILDSMVMTHLTGREGGLECMKTFSHPDGSTLVTPENVVLFGFDPLQPATEHWVYLLENGFKCFTRPTVKRDPTECARKALQWLEDRVDAILLHFDVDVIDSGVFPLANYPHYAGLVFEEAMAAVDTFLQSEKVLGIVITEVNPNNDPSGVMVIQLVDALVSSLAVRRSLLCTPKDV